MDIIHDEKNRIFYIGSSDSPEVIGKLTYIPRGNKIIVNHTWVTPERRGGNLGEQLVLSAAKYARENNLKIIPKCSYVSVVAERYPNEFKDVLEENN